MSERTTRAKLPLLATGQAQKEVTHNEALTLIDALFSTTIESIGDTTPPSNPVLGQAWIVGPNATGLWQGHSQKLACWTEGGWRFIEPFKGQMVWNNTTTMNVRYTGGQWVQGTENANQFKVQGVKVVGAREAAISSPTGGATIDQEARIALNTVLSALRSHGLIAT